MPVHASDSIWILETASMGYAFGLNPAGRLTHCYWGARLPYPGDYPAPSNPPFWGPDGAAHFTPEEYPVYGGISYVDPCLKVTFADGVRDLALAYHSYTLLDAADPELIIHLQDTAYPLRLNLHYRLYEKYDLLERWVTLENQGQQPVWIERAFSAKWTLPHGDDYTLTHLYGRWADEFHLQRSPLTVGLKTLESRRITSSHHANPWFALDRRAGEDTGDVWFGSLAWSGNWKMNAEVTEFRSTRLSIGLNDWDFAWKLSPGETFQTPPALAGYTPAGFGAASRRLHDYVRERLLPHANLLHPVLYNSWEATLFNVDQTSQARLAELAAEMGVELFVMDDGWFHGRNWDNAGLGDWWPDEVKFPHGLGGLIQKVKDLGMTFGLWVEPEMVNPNSELYRAHPDWVIHFPTRARTESRNQLILNLGRPDVQEYLIDVLDRLLRENDIRFIKWDMNRNASEPGWPDAPGDPRELWLRYVQGLYRVWDTLRRRHPAVVWQSCSSGGGRADLGILRLADQVWVSDNTEATSRLRIQEGYSHFLPANTMEAWVTDADRKNLPLEFRFHVSMCGSLGVGGNLLEWSQDERELAARCIHQYKEIRHIIQAGDQYRLVSAQQAAFSAVQYLSKDQAQGVLFAFRTHIPDYASLVKLPPIYLRGLDPTALYRVDGFKQPRSGAAWMHAGLTVELQNMQSKLLRIQKV